MPLENAEITRQKIERGTNPQDESDYRSHYFPKTEQIGENEMRVTALGTGMPNQRPSQASAAWLIELGNGDALFFDIGTGCMSRFASMSISYNRASKVFLTHLHADHAGDLAALWLGGWVANRAVPLRVWGPAGKEERFGTKHFIDHQRASYAWDVEGRRMAGLPSAGGDIEVTEFDYTDVQTIYDENGVKIISFPAIHIHDGPVSFRLEWNGLVFVYSGDTHPNRWFVENSQNADLLIHESFVTVDALMEKQGFTQELAVRVGTQVHTSPGHCGEVFNLTKPRLAVAYHFFNDWDTAPAVQNEIQATYDGPFVLANDYMVFNVTKEHIKVRMAVTPEDVWPSESAAEAAERPEVMQFGGRGSIPSREIAEMSEWLRDSELVFD
jgi:ribonuclease Z